MNVQVARLTIGALGRCSRLVLLIVVRFTLLDLKIPNFGTNLELFKSLTEEHQNR